MPGAWLGTQNGVNQPTFITTGLSAAPSVSGLHKDDHSLLGSAKPTASHRFKACSQDSSDDTQDTALHNQEGWGQLES